MSITSQLNDIKSNIPKNVTLVAVSKYQPIESIQEAYNAKQRIFGESRAQELVNKYKELPKDIEWHMIGNLQSTNVKYIAPFVSLIHSVHSLKLLDKINKEATKNNRIIDCLLEFHIAQEESKSGLYLEEAEILLESSEYTLFKNIRIVGVMAMASYTNDESQISKEFNILHNIFTLLKNKYFSSKPEFKEISMGMSGDYKLAIQAGSSMVRIGSSIFQ